MTRKTDLKNGPLARAIGRLSADDVQLLLSRAPRRWRRPDGLLPEPEKFTRGKPIEGIKLRSRRK